MKLTPQELLAIQLRELRNQANRERQRVAWNQERERENYRRSRQLDPVTIPVGPQGSLTITGRAAVLRWGALAIGFQKFDEQKLRTTILRLQDSRKAWPDGTLRGVKRLLKTSQGWVSPTQGSLWVDDEMHGELGPTTDLRSVAGVHAVWVDQLEELNLYQGRLVELAGWGNAVTGDLGWRAEHARIVRELI